MLFWSLIKWITPKIRMLYFVLINSAILKLVCVWINIMGQKTFEYKQKLGCMDLCIGFG